jgi:hypothetical protein
VIDTLWDASRISADIKVPKSIHGNKARPENMLLPKAICQGGGYKKSKATGFILKTNFHYF